MKIDVHAHYVAKDCYNVTDSHGVKVGPTLTTDESGQECFSFDGIKFGEHITRLLYDPETRIKDMDRMRVDIQAISISPTNFFYDIDGDLGLIINKKQNDRIADVVTAYPDRFVGIAGVPMQDIPKAITELERAVTQLKFKGVQINTNINGKNLDDAQFMPFFEKVQALDIPILLHPYRVVGAERLRNHFLINLIGNPFDTTIAVASLIFGGVFERFPKLKVICAHAGGAVPIIKGRWQHAYKHAVVTNFDLPRPPMEYMRNIYFDTITHYGPALNYLIEDHGADRIVMGSDFPYDMGDSDPLATIENLNLPATLQDRITGENAISLLKL
ncbi:amidohydrolase family protein [Chloroflexota bacterium]